MCDAVRGVYLQNPRSPQHEPPWKVLKTSAAMELVCIDFWSAEDKNKNSVDVLVATDHFTKMAFAFPCRNQTAKQVARKLWDCVFCVYGFPERIHSDQGPSFESELVSELLQLSGVAKSHTTAYHPMGNGGTERFNRTLGNMIRSLPLRAKQEWPQQIQTLTFAYNATAHETTGYAPFHLMFGRVPRLPVDVVFQSVLHDLTVTDFSSYSRTLLSYLSEAANIAQQHATKEQEQQARQYNKKVRGVSLHVGARVLLANKGEKGKKKLADKWEPAVYTVVEQNPKTHIYKISDASGQSKVVHRNLLLDVSFLPIQDTLENQSFVSSSEVEGTSVCGDVDSLSNLERESSLARTSSWVLLDPDRAAEASADEEVSIPEFEDESHAHEDMAGSPEATLSDPDLVQSNAPTDVDTTPTDSTPTQACSPADSTATQTAVVDNRIQGRVVTRTGRVVRSVNRLIESMVQRPVIWGLSLPQKV